MALPITIEGAQGKKRQAFIDPSHALRVINVPFPPLIEQKIVPFRQFFTDDGLSTGSNNMRVDGSSTVVDFWISADNEDDRYITTLSFLIADAGASLSKFGNLSALTNGLEIFYTRITGAITIADELKTNLDVIRFANGQPAFGTAGDAYLLKNSIGANVDAYFPNADLTKMMPPFGIKLDKGTKQRLTIRIQDNLSTGMDGFDVIATGFDRLKDD